MAVVKNVTSDASQVRKVIVGRPIRRVSEAKFSLSQLEGVDLTNLENGSLLIYNDGSQNFEASRDLEDQNINGGNY